MGDVIRLDAERWAQAFANDDLVVEVSSKGRVRFFTADHERGATITMAEMLSLGQALSQAYGGEEENDNGRTDPTV